MKQLEETAEMSQSVADVGETAERAEGGHTPGPWTYVRNPEKTRWIIDSAPSHAIACTAGYEPDNEGNARLIAAAPELLAELIALRRRFHNACRATGSTDEYVLESTPGADAAIRKATS
jgi:hypothetical protein